MRAAVCVLGDGCVVRLLRVSDSSYSNEFLRRHTGWNASMAFMGSGAVVSVTIKEHEATTIVSNRDFRILSEKSMYKNPWLEVSELQISREGKPGTYSVVYRQDTVAIIVRNSSNELLMLKQYRFPTQANSWEIPMGGIEKGESPLQAATRELKEETGIDLQNGRHIGTFRPVPGLTPQRVHVFSVFVNVSELDANLRQVDEIISKKFVSQSEFRKMVSDGRVSDGFTLSSLALEDALT
ncbi:hypothetical protein CSA80_03295 [Candidatus Saccharibacteria bacterium]|nr:MAG: hypothetical protein CSA80_03295 [Candidatus Saccharibacteria bacterium]